MAINPANYTYRQQIEGLSPSATNSGQVLVITEASVDATFWSNIANGGGPLRVTEDSDGANQLPLEVVLCDTVSQTLIAWTRKPSYSSADRSVYVFAVDNSDTQPPVTDTFGRNAVWQDYELVIHQGTSADSSGSHTPALIGTPSLVTGLFGQDMYSFSGTDRIQVPSSAELNFLGGFGILEWREYTSSIQYSFDKVAGNADGYRVFADTSKLRLRTPTTTPSNLDAAALPPSVLTQNVYNLDTGASSKNIYSNGSLDVSDTFTGAYSGNTADLVIGNSVDFDRPNTAGQSETWFRNAPFTSDEVATHYNNQSNPGTFWTQFAPDDPSAGGGVTGGIAVTIPTPTFSADGSATLPQPAADAAFTLPAPVFAVEGSATITVPDADIAVTVPAPTFSADGSATLPQPSADVDATLPAPTFSVEGSATISQPVGNVAITIPAPTFNADGSATLPQPNVDIGITIPQPVFTIEGSVSVTFPVADIAVTIPAPTFSVSGSVTLPQPDADVSLEVQAPVFDVRGTVSGFGLEPAPRGTIVISKPSKTLLLRKPSKRLKI